MESNRNRQNHNCLAKDLAEIWRSHSLFFSGEFGEGFSEYFSEVAAQIALNLAVNLVESHLKDR